MRQIIKLKAGDSVPIGAKFLYAATELKENYKVQQFRYRKEYTACPISETWIYYEVGDES